MQFKSKIAIDIHVHNRDGINFTANALIDTGSQYNLCPASLINKSLLTNIMKYYVSLENKDIILRTDNVLFNKTMINTSL